MDPIYEEDADYVARQSESKSVKREIFRSEKVESSTRTLPEEKAMAMEARYYDQDDLGPADMSSTSYTYTYESTYDPTAASASTSPYREVVPPGLRQGPPPGGGVGDGEEGQNGFYDVIDEGQLQAVERHSSQTERVTRVTKVTTTKTVQHIPVEGETVLTPGGYYETSQATPSPSRYGTMPQQAIYALDGARDDYADRVSPLYGMIKGLERGCRQFVQQNAKGRLNLLGTPSAPGIPQVIDIDSTMVTLAWSIPDYEGDYGPIHGYQVQFRRIEDSDWRSACPHLITEPRYTVYALEPNGRYEFRTVAKNGAGYGDPSSPSPVVQLRSKYSHIPKQRQAFEPCVPFPPGRPKIVDIDASSATIAWEAPIDSGSGGPVAGYQIEYRPSNTQDWLFANDHIVTETSFKVHGLRPNGEYEFRVLAKNADGLSEPSQSSGSVRIRPAAPSRSPNLRRTPDFYAGVSVPDPPSQPCVTDVDVDMVTLLWAAPPMTRAEANAKPLTYILEFRELGDPRWYNACDRPIQGTQFTIVRLKPNSTYEFRVFARNSDAMSEPSETSEVVQLRPKLHGKFGMKGPPPPPEPPELMEIVGNNAVICWAPVQSNPPVQGYEVEFQDTTENPGAWGKVTEILIKTCKMTIGDLVPRHKYVFRVTAKNAINYSEPSPPSCIVVVEPEMAGVPPIPPILSDPSELLRRDSGSISEVGVPLPVEINEARESPPITDTDDSPPPIRRHPTSGTDRIQYRDPTLPEVLEYLSNPNHVIRLNAAGYLQHLTYHDDLTKHRVRELDGIPRIIDLLSSDMPEVQKNACGCLRNLSYGIDENKRAILLAGGVPALANLLRKTPDMQVVEEITGVLWNLSSGHELKVPVLQHAVEPLVKQIVIPYFGWSPTGQITENGNGNGVHPPPVFRNATGVLRNVSSASEASRRALRERDGLTDALVNYLRMACDRAEYDTKSVENIVCILRNLSYRLQEIEDPNYDKQPLPHERSKSAPSGSPKVKAKKEKGGKKKNGGRDEAGSEAGSSSRSRLPAKGVALLWQPDIVKKYVTLLVQSNNPETLEASAGALQNLAACYWQPSIDIRAAVRKEKGLAVLVQLLNADCDKVVCAAAAALRNLAMDEKNKELIGKYGISDLVKKLPSPETPRPPNASDDTIASVLSVIYITTLNNANFARTLHETGGVQRLIYISRSSGDFEERVVRYASLVLDSIWRHRELQDDFRRAGLKETDFIMQTTSGRSGADTLARPVGTQGVERGRGGQSRVRPDWNDDYSRRSPAEPSPGSGGYATAGAGIDRGPTSGQAPPAQSPPYRSGEPLYAQVQKKRTLTQPQPASFPTRPSASVGHTPMEEPAYDSWV